MFNHPEQFDRKQHARMSANIMLSHNGVDDTGYRVLCKVLGYATGAELMTRMTEDDARLCELMGGPNGWAIYKALEARKKTNAGT